MHSHWEDARTIWSPAKSPYACSGGQYLFAKGLNRWDEQNVSHSEFDKPGDIVGDAIAVDMALFMFVTQNKINDMR